jgi:alkylation response protein AidB-like acyl-CoA dehydrogenase
MTKPTADAGLTRQVGALDEEQRSLQQTVIEFAQRELNDDLDRRDHEAEFSREAWVKCAAIGLQGLPVPTEYGGAGAGATTIAAALEGLGYGCADNGLIFALNAQMWACELPILTFASEEQKRRYLPGLCDGSLIGAHAMTEPGSGSDAFSMATTAVPTADGWVLNGSKTFATNAPDADVFVVFAATDRSLRRALGLPDRPRRSGPDDRSPALEDGPAHFAHGRGVPRRLRGARGRPARQRRRRDGDLQHGDALGAGPDPRGCGRHDAQAARALRELRP